MEKINKDNTSNISGGNSVSSNIQASNPITIKISYPSTAGRSAIRRRLIQEMEISGIPTDKVPSAFTLWQKGMTAGVRSGTLVYVCRADGSMVRCFKG